MSESPLLTPKLRPPHSRARLVARPRITDRLETSQKPIILISAPAGSGKTTLVHEWLQSSEPGASRPVAWLSLDEEDNDPARFFAYFSAALQKAAPSLERLIQSWQALPQPPGRSLMAALLNRLDSAPSPERPTLFVLDDYHLIRHDAIHDLVAYFLNHLPPGLRVVLVTREEPPLPVGRWRARNELLELRGRELRFNHEEAEQYFNAAMRLRLTPDQITLLEQRTEGWITGLQLAAVALQNEADVDLTIQEFAGSHQYVADYLMGEIFRRQPAEIRDFLLETSVLGRLTGPLCDALREQGGSAALLEQLAQSNLFLQGADAQGEWYQYHQLFRAFLLQHLTRTTPERPGPLHCRAARWHEQQGLWAEALHHYLAAEELGEAARLVGDLSMDFLRRGELLTLRGWLDPLPDTLLRSDPRLCLARIWTLMNTNQTEAAASYIEQAGTFLEEGVGGREQPLKTEILTLQAISLTLRGEPSAALRLAEQARQIHNAQEPFLRALTSFGLAAGHKMAGQSGLAEHYFLDSSAAGLQAGNRYLAFTGMGNAGDMQFELGQLPQARETLLRALALLGVSDEQPHPFAGWIYGSLGRIHYQWNELDTAAELAERAVALCESWANFTMWVLAHLLRARLAFARGQIPAAQAILDQAERVALRSGERHLYHQIIQERVVLAVAQGDIVAARHWGTVLEAGAMPLSFRDHGALARVRLADDRPAEALLHLEQARQRVEALDFVAFQIPVLLLTAAAHERQGDHAASRAALTRALHLAAPGRMRRTILDEGRNILHLLSAIPRHGSFGPFLAELMDRSEAVRPDIHLTRREREILQMLADGLTNRAIAKRLVIAESTLKRHLSNLYLKLDAHSRAEAIARATTERLL